MTVLFPAIQGKKPRNQESPLFLTPHIIQFIQQIQVALIYSESDRFIPLWSLGPSHHHLSFGYLPSFLICIPCISLFSLQSVYTASGIIFFYEIMITTQYKAIQHLLIPLRVKYIVFIHISKASSLISSPTTHLCLVHSSHNGVLAILQHARHIPVLGPAHLLFPPLKMLFLQIDAK